MKKKLVIVGGGASGYFCAVNAARQCEDLDVVIIEKTNKILSKVKISGGGRCNVTHYTDEIPEMTNAYPRGKHFMKKSLYRFSNKDTVTWFKERGVELKVEEDGRMFPTTNDSQTIIDCLANEAYQYGVGPLLQTRVLEINQSQASGFDLMLQKHDGEQCKMHADFICVATGGTPSLSGFEWLQKMGIAIEPPVPSLFTFNIADQKLHELMGISVSDAHVRIIEIGIHEKGPVLITHWGLSGPAILKLSSRAAMDLHRLNYEVGVRINWLPSFNESSILQDLKNNRERLARQAIGNKNPYALPNRLWNYLLMKSMISSEQSWSNISGASMNLLAKVTCADLYQVKGKTTFKEEFVTAGGVKLECLDQSTMESNTIKGMYFAGEVVNVDGITGGYNFQHAWSSGWIVACSVTSLMGQAKECK